MDAIKMTTEEQLALVDFMAIYNLLGQLAQGDFVNYDDTATAIRIHDNMRVIESVLEHAEDSVEFKDVRKHLLNISDVLVTRWKHFLPEDDLAAIEESTEKFRGTAIERLVENGLSKEEAQVAVGKIGLNGGN